MIGILVGFIIAQVLSAYLIDDFTVGEAWMISIQLVLYSFVLNLKKKAKWF